jgi:hypothetical protein
MNLILMHHFLVFQLQNTGEQVDQADQIQELLAEKGELLEKLRVVSIILHECSAL